MFPYQILTKMLFTQLVLASPFSGNTLGIILILVTLQVDDYIAIGQALQKLQRFVQGMRV